MITAQYFSSHSHTHTDNFVHIMYFERLNVPKENNRLEYSKNAHAHEQSPTKRLHRKAFQDISPEYNQFYCVQIPTTRLPIPSTKRTNYISFRFLYINRIRVGICACVCVPYGHLQYTPTLECFVCRRVVAKPNIPRIFGNISRKTQDNG